MVASGVIVPLKACPVSAPKNAPPVNEIVPKMAEAAPATWPSGSSAMALKLPTTKPNEAMISVIIAKVSQ